MTTASDVMGVGCSLGELASLSKRGCTRNRQAQSGSASDRVELVLNGGIGAHWTSDSCTGQRNNTISHIHAISNYMTLHVSRTCADPQMKSTRLVLTRERGRIALLCLHTIKTNATLESLHSPHERHVNINKVQDTSSRPSSQVQRLSNALPESTRPTARHITDCKATYQ